MIEGGLLSKLTKKKRDRGLDDAEKEIYMDLTERGEPDLTYYYPKNPISKWLTESYQTFASDVCGINLFHTQMNFSGRVIETIIHNHGKHITALFSRQCVTEDMLILNQSGQFIPIKDMVEGEFGDVVGMDEEMYQIYPGRIRKFHKNGNRQIYKVRTESGFEIKCTDNHPFFVRGNKVRTLVLGNWIPLKRLRKGKIIATYKSIPVFGDCRESEYKIKALGYFFGTTHHELDRVERFYTQSRHRMGEIETVFDRFGESIIKENLSRGYISGDSNCLRWVADNINSDGTLPSWVELLDRKLLRLFLSRYWATHMITTKHKAGVENGPDLLPQHSRSYAVYGPKKFLYQMKLILLKFSVKTKLSCKNDSWRLNIDKYEVPRFAYQIEPYRVRKLKIPEKMSRYSRDTNWERVISIEKLGMEETYDVSVSINVKRRKYWLGEKVSQNVYHNLFENGFVCHNSGKTQNMALLTSFFAVFLPTLAAEKGGMWKQWEGGFWCGIYAPIKEQAQTMFERLKDTLRSDVISQFGQSADISNGRTFALTNQSLIMSQSASDNSSVESKSWHTVVLEEAQGISERKVQKSIMPMMSFYNGSPIFIGTSTDRKCHFYNEIQDNIQNNPEDHLQYDYRDICYVHEPYYKFVRKQINKYGWDSDYFKMSYRLIWVLEHGQFVTYSDLKRCARYDLERGVLLKSQYPKYVGIDVAKDPAQTVGTVISVIDGDRIILDWIALGGEDYESQSQYLTAWMGGMNTIKAIYVDSTSKDGDSMTEKLTQKLSRRIVPIKFTPMTKNDMYRAFDLSIKGENGIPNFYYPCGKATVKTREFRDFFAQMIDLEKDYRGGLLVAHKPKKRNSFDDYCDSTALAIWASCQESTVSLSATPINKKGGRDKRFASKRFADMSNRFRSLR